MKKYYNNFHRARKYHRKLDSAVYQGFINKADKYQLLYYKYDDIVRKEGIYTTIRKDTNGINRYYIKSFV